MSDDTPTQRFEAQGPQGQGGPEAQGGPGRDAPQGPKKSRALLIALIIVGAVLLIAIAVLIVVLLRGPGEASAGPTTAASESSIPSDTPPATPSTAPTPSPAATDTDAPPPPPPPPPSNAPVINSFTAGSTTVFCNESAPTGDHQPISFSWNSSNVTQVYFGVDTADASAAPFFSNLPPSGTSNDDFPDGYNHGAFEYPCTAASTKYTLTVVGNGQKVSRSVTIANKGDQ